MPVVVEWENSETDCRRNEKQKLRGCIARNFALLTFADIYHSNCNWLSTSTVVLRTSTWGFALISFVWTRWCTDLCHSFESGHQRFENFDFCWGSCITRARMKFRDSEHRRPGKMIGIFFRLDNIHESSTEWTTCGSAFSSFPWQERKTGNAAVAAMIDSWLKFSLKLAPEKHENSVDKLTSWLRKDSRTFESQTGQASFSWRTNNRQLIV